MTSAAAPLAPGLDLRAAVRDRRPTIVHGAPVSALGLDHVCVRSLLEGYAARSQAVLRLKPDARTPYVPRDADDWPADSALAFVDVHRVEPAIFALTRRLQRVLGVNVECNAYASAEDSATPGLATHFDPYPVVVVQLRGAKHWTFGAQLARYPDVGMPFHTLEDPCPPWFSCAGPVEGAQTLHTSTASLTAGSIAVVPAGTWHETHARGSSLSLTFGARAPTWIALLRGLVRQLCLDTAPNLLIPARGWPHRYQAEPFLGMQTVLSAMQSLHDDPASLSSALLAVFDAGRLSLRRPTRVITAPSDPPDPPVGYRPDSLEGLFPSPRDVTTFVRDPWRRVRTFAPQTVRPPWLERLAANPATPTSNALTQVAQWRGRGVGRVVVTRNAEACPPLEELRRRLEPALRPWAQRVDATVWSSRDPEMQSPWFCRACDTIAIVCTGELRLEHGPEHGVFDDDEDDAGVWHFRRPLSRDEGPAPTAEGLATLPPGAVTTIPRGTWTRVSSAARGTSWVVLSLRQPSWLGLWECTVSGAAAGVDALARCAVELFATGLVAPPAGSHPAIGAFLELLQASTTSPATMWALWRDWEGFGAGRFVAPTFAPISRPWSLATTPAGDIEIAAAGGDAPPLRLTGTADPVVRWIVAVDRPFSLTGLATSLGPGAELGPILRVLRALTRHGLLAEPAFGPHQSQGA